MSSIKNFVSKIKSILSNQNKNWLIFTGIAVIAVIIVLLATQPMALRVVAVDPPNQTPDMPLDSHISATFNRPIKTIDQSTIQFILEPQVAGQVSFLPDGTQAVFTPQANYQDHRDYLIKIIGRDLKEYTFTFHTRAIPDSARFPIDLPPPGPANLQDPKQRLLNKLPYYDDNFLIEYTMTRNIIYISIWNQPIDQYQQAALDWIETFGYQDPQTELNIQFNIPRNLIPESATSLAP